MALLPAGCRAWSANGHMTIGYIAQDLLTQAAKNGDPAAQTTLDNVKTILGVQTLADSSLAELAPCADEIRIEPPRSEGIVSTPRVSFDGQYQSSMQNIVDGRLKLAGVRLAELLEIALGRPQGGAQTDAVAGKKKEKFHSGSNGSLSCAGLELQGNSVSAPWHFIDIPINADPSGWQQYCDGGNCVVTQIEEDAATLRNAAIPLTDQRKQYALMYLVHFVGDEHQPLHCSDDNDRGGNEKPVKLTAPSAGPPPDATAESKLNLHSLWDHLINVADDGNDPVKLSSYLENGLQMDPMTGSWAAGSDDQAVEQTQQLATAAALESFSFAAKTVYPAYYSALCAQYPSDCPKNLKGLRR